ncbi:Dimethylaniline monooxygenase [N-oxide-forming] 2 [Colletotrichum orbiculare MAFF 240422]|uniref:Dimethylaniline monooxygenase [N-oxide-forming] 2 n=1 Tax=Colletotrichum orbiculare (strain 104-T / ATCC 96160 / CBS 514.97 / LARS 414 / MAFF 240422) TaxID=1213857 RepID=A0A484F9K6_COLOR|nr:Dimethylaniline monooxygenase [N-oxide-forming] 2 [Colletotrichum orbiculare MAFF 240422]
MAAGTVRNDESSATKSSPVAANASRQLFSVISPPQVHLQNLKRAWQKPPTKELDLSLLDMESLQSSPDALSLPPVPETIPAFPEPTWTWTVDDLELQHHYLGVMEHFANGMPMRREEVLRLSFRHHCVLHLMLAVSAMHLSRHSPEKARHWEEVADGHYTVGLRQVMEMLPTLNKDNCGAMYAASTLVCTYSFASRPSTGHLLLVSDGAEVAWLELLRGVRFVAETMGYDAIFSGELTPLPSDADKGGWPPEQTRARVVEWGLPFKTVSDVISAAGGPEFEVYEKMLTTLSDCFEETFGTAEQPKYTTNGKLQCVIGKRSLHFTGSILLSTILVGEVFNAKDPKCLLCIIGLARKYIVEGANCSFPASRPPSANSPRHHAKFEELTPSTFYFFHLPKNTHLRPLLPYTIDTVSSIFPSSATGNLITFGNYDHHGASQGCRHWGRPIWPDIEIRVFEREDKIGGVYRYKVYEEAEMVSSKYLTAFSDFRVPKYLPDFLPMEEYVRYLEEYCTNFNLWDLIETNTEILHVSKQQHGGHRVSYARINSHDSTKEEGAGSDFWDCDAIAICSGLNNVPSIPSIDGLENVPLVLHSSEVKTREQFDQKRSVLILGAGETAMDLAHLAITSNAQEVTLCHKEGFFCAKKASLHWAVGGTAPGPDQWVGAVEGDRNNVDSLFLVKSDRALPYLNEGLRATNLLSRMRAYYMNVELKDTKGRKILTAPWPLAFSNEGIAVFPHSQKREHQEALAKLTRPDMVVLATGYVRRFFFLSKEYPEPNELNVRGIWRRGDVTAGFIGFVRPGIGAIPPLSELQAQLWVLTLLRHKYPQQVPWPAAGPGQPDYPHAVPHYEVDYALKARGGHDLFKTKHGVEQESYAYQLALDMGAAPTLSFVWHHGYRAFFTWAMGSNFNTKFRLVGPWKWETGALAIMRSELYNVVKQTGGGVFFTTYTILPLFFFGGLTLILQSISALFRLLGFKRQAKAVLGSGKVPRREGKD